jgi:hypothetical protein
MPADLNIEIAAHGIASMPPARTYSSLDRVGWGIYRGLLEALGGVRFGRVVNGKVVWEDGGETLP